MIKKNGYQERLIKNTLIFTIGNLGTKVLQFLIVPLYSFYLSVSELGRYDMIMTTINLLIPIITIQISDALYRWLIDERENRLKVYYAAGKILVVSLLIFMSISVGIIITFDVKNFSPICIICIEQAIFTFLLEGIRGLYLNKAYAIFGSLYSFFLLINLIVFLIFLHSSLKGIFFSMIISYFVMDVIMCLFTYKNLVYETKFKDNITFSYYINMIKYSVPYIPNTLCWWIVNVSDRWMIKYFLGLSENGIYLVATRLPAIIITFMTFFQYSWQEVAITEYKNEKQESIFENIFKRLYQFLFTVSMMFIPSAKYIVYIMFGKSYYSAWQYIPILFVGIIYSSLSTFLGVGYQRSKKSREAMNTTILAAIINVLINLVFMKRFGLYIACISTMIAYMVLFFVRLFTMRKYFKIIINYKDFCLFNLAIFIELVLVMANEDIINIFLIIFSIFQFIKFNDYIIKKIKTKREIL